MTVNVVKCRPLPMRTGRPALDTLHALAVGAVAFAVAVLLGLLVDLPFATGCRGMGTRYQEMSVAPFALRGEHPHRILSPLLGYLMGLGGERYWLFCHGSSVVFLATVFGTARHLGAMAIDAGLITLAIACTGAVTLYTSLLVGFSDTLTFTLLLATLVAARRGPWCWLVHLLNLVNHDLALFFTPLVLYLRWQTNPGWRRELLWLGGALAVYAGYRLWISAVAPDLRLTVDFYVKTSHFPKGTLGLAALATADSVRLFGPLLVVMFWAAWQPARRWENKAVALCVLTIYSFLVVAYDFSRFTSYLFLPVGAAAIRFLHGGRNRWLFAALIAGLVWGGAWVGARVVPRVGQAMFECKVFDDPRQFACVVEKTAGILGWLGVALLALLAVSYALARLLPARDREPS